MNAVMKDEATPPGLCESLSFETYSPSLDAELLTLFEACFGHPMPLELWHWKMQTMLGVGVAARYDNELIAFYGGMPRLFHFRQESLPTLQIRDVMVKPKMRGVLRKKGPFALTAEHFLDHFVHQNGSFVSAFGFPNSRAYKVGNLTGLYLAADSVFEAKWQTKRSYFRRLTDLDTLSSLNITLLDSLQKAMMTKLDNYVLGQRDWHYLEKRYIKHPLHNYRFLCLQHGCFEKSVLIVREHGDQRLEWVDFIGDPAILKKATKHLMSWGAKEGFYEIFGWFSRSVLTYLPKTTEASFVCNVPIPASHGINWPDHSLQHWWLMSGDTDFK